MTPEFQSILEESEETEAQIKFCQQMSFTTKRNGDRDLAHMYAQIACSLSKLYILETQPNFNHHDGQQHNRQPKDQMGQTAIKDGADDPADGKGA